MAIKEDFFLSLLFNKIFLDDKATLSLSRIVGHEITLVINTPLGAQSRFDENSIGIAATQARIPVLTTLSAAQALIKAIKSNNKNQVRSIQEIHNF